MKSGLSEILKCESWIHISCLLTRNLRMGLAHLRQGKQGIFTCDFCIVLVDKLLDHRKSLTLKSCGFLGHDFLNLCQKVVSHVFISVTLKYISWQFNSVITLGVNEMTKIASGTPSRPMEISTGDCSIVTWFDQLIWVGRRI